MLKLDQHCFESDIAYSRAELSSYVNRKGSFTIVAAPEQEPKRVAGFITVEMHSKGYGHVITIDIHEEFRRKGLGTQLMKAAEEKVRDLEGFMLALEVAVNNAPAIEFYRKHGYQKVKTIAGYYQGRLDALLLTKRL